MSASSQKYVPPALRQGRSSKTTTGLATVLVSQILSLLRQLNENPGSIARSLLFRQLHALFSNDGRTLFDYFALSFLQVAGVADGIVAEYAPRLRTLRYSAGVQKSRGWWAEQTKVLKHELDCEDRDALLRLVRDSDYRVKPFNVYYINLRWAASKDAQESRVCKFQVLRHAWYELGLMKLPQHDLWKTGLFKEEVRPRTITSTLLGGPVPEARDFSTAICGIIAGIQARIDRNPKLILRGRIDGVRIDFTPKATGVTSIKTRLRTICHRGGLTADTKYDQEDPLETCEWLLGALVHWNTTDFADIPGALMPNPELIPEIQADSHTLHEGNCLNWLGLDLTRFDVLTHTKKKEVVGFIMERLRSHVLKVATFDTELSPGAKLIIANLKGDSGDYYGQPNYCWKWSLAQGTDWEQGFTGQLWQCFDREGLASEEYEDLLEQQLHRLRRRTENTDIPSDEGDFLQLEKYPVQDDI